MTDWMQPRIRWDSAKGEPVIPDAFFAAMELDVHRANGYSGPNQRLGDYFIREMSRDGTDRRQTVRFEVVGTGRIESMARSRFEKMVRPA